MVNNLHFHDDVFFMIFYVEYSTSQVDTKKVHDNVFFLMIFYAKHCIAQVSQMEFIRNFHPLYLLLFFFFFNTTMIVSNVQDTFSTQFDFIQSLISVQSHPLHPQLHSLSLNWAFSQNPSF